MEGGWTWVNFIIDFCFEYLKLHFDNIEHMHQLIDKFLHDTYVVTEEEVDTVSFHDAYQYWRDSYKFCTMVEFAIELHKQGLDIVREYEPDEQFKCYVGYERDEFNKLFILAIRGLKLRNFDLEDWPNLKRNQTCKNNATDV